jgi:hypothetical protein
MSSDAWRNLVTDVSLLYKNLVKTFSRNLVTLVSFAWRNCVSGTSFCSCKNLVTVTSLAA